MPVVRSPLTFLMHRTLSILVATALLATALLAPAVGVSAQDVEMLGERYGTPVPAGYERTKRADPTAFEFRGGMRGSETLNLRSFEGVSGGGPARSLGPRDPVLGTYRIPVVLGMYGNSGGTPPFDQPTIEDAYFGAAAGTITAYYTEVSNGRATLNGDVLDWVQTARPDTAYTVGESGLVGGALGGGGAGNFVYELLELQSGSVDWGQYDNDGPDGDPNSGDDDGYVDVLAVIHPTRGGECGGSGSDDRIWSHRWSLASAVGTIYETTTPRPGGGFVRVNDYTIQPSIACTGGVLNEIGVFTHELGHAFGLPDLYDTCNGGSECPDDFARTSGAGIWDLMASGSWGCNNASPNLPCHLGAWSKAMLGWVDVVGLAPDTDHGTITIPPVETDGTVYRIDANDGSGEYFLLENRQRIGFDQNVYNEGLLVWQIDEDWVLDRWPPNRVNANEHQGVWLRQADGLDELGSGFGRGDSSDPFPGSLSNTAFHATTTPGAISFGGGVTGVTLFDIQLVGDDVSLRASTRFTTLTLDAQGTAGSDGIFTVNGQQVDPPETAFQSAPFVSHTIEAVAGESVGPGERRPFLEWSDDTLAPRSRSIVTPLADTSFVANYGGTQFEFTLTTSGAVNAVEPATFESDPASEDLWYSDGAAVTLEVIPTPGYLFQSWSGDLAGQGNPASFTMNAPLSAVAAFELVYRVPDTSVELPAATPLQVQLEIENGTAPAAWRVVAGTMPTGLTLSRGGEISGEALDLGTFALTLEAVDAIGLPGTGTVTLELVAPELSIEQLASPFLLTGPQLTSAQINFLNRQGNRVAPYDIGDFRQWVLSDPTLPLSASMGDGVFRRTVIVGTTEGGAPPRGEQPASPGDAAWPSSRPNPGGHP